MSDEPTVQLVPLEDVRRRVGEVTTQLALWWSAAIEDSNFSRAGGLENARDTLKAAKGLSPADVQKRWPRLGGPCPKGCGYVGIAYASEEHYVAGDW